MADSRTAIIVALISALAVLGAAIIANADKFSAETAERNDAVSAVNSTQTVAITAENATIPTNVVADTSTPRSSGPSRPQETTGPPFTESFSDIGVTLTFVPTHSFRRLIEYRTTALSPGEDSSCTAPYSAQERVTRIAFAWGFVIERFWTWNEREGQQEYIVDETLLPRSSQGSLHDLVREGRTLTITKQRCGQGQVASFVAVAL
jgi:hypothetical protein